MFRTIFARCSSRLKNGSVSVCKAEQFPSSRFKRLLHSTSIKVEHQKMEVQIIPALEDNYMYLIIDGESREAAIVDPVSPDQVICAVKDNACKLTKVLTTHHHWDHAGGNECLASSITNLTVYGGDSRIGALNCKVEHGSIINVGNLKIECLSTPCHTKGHICYYVTRNNSEPAVFTGDTLFVGGCGRFFEGTPAQMNCALNEILAKLPDETKVYCGHEYTVQNLKFGLHVDPTNQAMKEKLEWACSRRKSNLPTIPSTIGEEKLINPFLRVCDAKVKLFTKKEDPIEVMGALRQAKDCFKAN
ncbi:hydroxyacylglutathione hydrolase, mitochondrial isoform X1 [Trichogramma pretiosum]|uniref:hydroxyacylglutathione hydrolase, mitochondrial isoform X1 n=2 Tax=Trichogramma pretiosum TaxID=7493 RepID=UPI0006C944FA|nr:hydroxyacylglutathione hydrolase, mitochondrial isoform X1 [Trichogramma pretiosum]